jgi:hypothetical protein|tara:strand:- start:682 stop:888 length:207 start_codon:yes stop_codon:yes gene_type:complete
VADGSINIEIIVMENNTPFKLSVKHWDRKITVEMDHSDITWDEYVELLRELSRAAGWNDESIQELFGS